MASLSINVAVKFQVAANFLFTLDREITFRDGHVALKVIGFTPSGSVVGTYEKRRLIPAVGGLYKHGPRVQKH